MVKIMENPYELNGMILEENPLFLEITPFITGVTTGMVPHPKDLTIFSVGFCSGKKSHLTQELQAIARQA